MSHIQQQMYTREREGIFNSTPGYDTIAKSKGLEKSFVKNVIHPLCSYYPPRELATVGEKDEAKYPKSRLITFTENGELILGQSAYKESDYTGERETFFSHNYIVPKDRVKDYLYSAAKVFGRIPFESGYDVSNGKELREFDELPAEMVEWKSLQSILTECSISIEQFKLLVFALISSLTSKKKVYISLPGEVSKVTETAYQLTYYLFHCVPFELRKSFGFISYALEPQNKKNLNLMFVEKGSIRPNDSLINKDFVFDFAQDLFLNTKENVSGHPFLQFTYDCLVSNKERLTEFFTYAENALYDQKNISLQHYNDLQTLYSIIEGSYQASEVNNSAILMKLRQFLTAENISKKEALAGTLLKLVAQESSEITVKQSPASEEMILQLLYFSNLLDQEQRAKIALYITYSLYFGATDIHYISKIYKHLKGQPSLFRPVNTTLFSNPSAVKRIIEPYVREQFTAITSLKTLVAEVKFWLQMNPEIIDNPEFVDTTKEMFISLFPKEKDGLVAFKSLNKELVGPIIQDDRISYYYKLILKRLAMLVMSRLSLETMTIEQFNQASIIAKSIPIDTSNENLKAKMELIHYVQEIMDSRQLADPERFLRYPDFGKLQSILLRLIKKTPIEEQTERIALCFYNTQQRSQNYNYKEMFTYVHSQGGTTAMAKFLYQFARQWRGKNTRDRGLEVALHEYLSEHSKETFKDKRAVKRWESIDPLVIRVLKQVKYEQMSIVGKFVHKNQKMLFVSLVSFLSVVIVVTVGFGVFKFIEYKKAEEAAAVALQEEKEAAEKAAKEAEEAAKKIAISANEIHHVDRDDNEDLLRIKAVDTIDMTNKDTVETLVINYNGISIPIIINNVSSDDISLVEEDTGTVVSIDLTITEKNIAEITDIITENGITTIPDTKKVDSTEELDTSEISDQKANDDDELNGN
jgi:hypothetical protein